MGKTKKWIKKLLTGKEDENKKVYSLTLSEIFTRGASVRNGVSTPETPKEEQGRSFRRSPPCVVPTVQIEQKKVVAVAYRRGGAVQQAAAVVIQSVFRSYLARKALKALKGLVKVQALARGYLVRKRTTAALHRMQSLATAQARARSQRIKMADESNSSCRIKPNQRKSVNRRSRQSNNQEKDRDTDENVRIVEMDVGESKRISGNSLKSHSNHHPQTPQTKHRSSKSPVTNRAYSKQERRQDLSVKPSALIDSSPRARSMHFDNYYFNTAQSSPQSSSAASLSEYPSQAKANQAFSKQERQDLLSPQPSAESGRFDDDYLESAQSRTNASSTTIKLPEYPSYKLANMESTRAKEERPRSGAGTRPNLKNAPRVGTRPDSNVDPWLAKLDRAGKERSDYGSSRTGHAKTGIGKTRGTWK